MCYLMGVVEDVVKNFDTTEKQKSEINETLHLLVELAKSKAEHCKDEIEESLNIGKLLGKDGSTKSLFFPISSVINSKLEYRCITKNTPTDLISDVSSAIIDMIDNSTAKGIVSGIANIINSSLKPLLGLASGVERFVSSTSTFIEGNGIAASIVRFDCMIWGRAVETESIKKEMSSTFACVAYKSVVDVSKISFDDFRSVYAPVLESSKIDNPIEAIKYAKEIYNLLDGGSKLPKDKESILNKNLTVDDLINCSEVKKLSI